MIRGKSLISFSVSLHIMTSYIWDICYQLCCHSLSNFEPEALPHQCRSSPNPFTSSSSSKVISSEIFTLHFHEKLLLWVVIVFWESIFIFWRNTLSYEWWPMVTYWRPMCCGFITSYLGHTVSCTLYITVSSLWFWPTLHKTCWFLSIAFTPNYMSAVLLSPSLVPLIPAEPEAIDAVTESKLYGGLTKMPNRVNNCWIQNVSSSLLETVI